MMGRGLPPLVVEGGPECGGGARGGLVCSRPPLSLPHRCLRAPHVARHDLHPVHTTGRGRGGGRRRRRPRARFVSGGVRGRRGVPCRGCRGGRAGGGGRYKIGPRTGGGGPPIQAGLAASDEREADQARGGRGGRRDGAARRCPPRPGPTTRGSAFGGGEGCRPAAASRAGTGGRGASSGTSSSTQAGPGGRRGGLPGSAAGGRHVRVGDWFEQR